MRQKTWGSTEIGFAFIHTYKKTDFLSTTYVDDHITAIPSEKIDMLKNALEIYNNKIKFTFETEDEQKMR